MSTATEYKARFKRKVAQGKRGFPGGGGAAGGTGDHAALAHLAYGDSGHTGFAQSVHNHNDLYYTETELNAGQLNNIYYTETEVNNLLADKAPIASPTFTGTVHAPILHSTTILTDHIGEHTGAHKIVFDNTVALPASTLVPDGGTIGQAAGPLLTFDDTNNYLEITGCNVGIGITPVSLLTLKSSVVGEAGGIRLLENDGTDISALLYEGTAGAGFLLLAKDATTTILLRGDTGNSYINTGGNFGIGFTSPLSALCINGGLHVGGASAVSDDNLLVDGTCGITGVTTLTGYTNTVGGVHVGGAADPGADNLWVDGISQHPDFVADLGYFGNNWRITAAGDAEFDNVTVRHTLKAFILEVDKIDVVGGRLVVSPASGTVYSWSFVAGTEYILVFDTNNDTNPIQFVVGDFVTAQTWKAYDHEVVSSFSGVVTAVTQHATLGSAHIHVTPTTGTPWDGMRLAQMGSTVAGRQSLLYLTSADTNNPFIEGHTGVTAGSFTNTTRKFRLGNLAGITDPTMGALTGYGLYSQNAYLTGRLVLPTAGMTNEGATAASIRIYAGDTYANRATAPFMVTQDGSLTATGVAELGTSTDIIGGITGNVAIKGQQIWENSRNADDGVILINYKGYQGGTTHYRNFDVCDGKNTVVLRCNGSTQVVSIPYGTLFINGLTHTLGGLHVGSSSDPGADNLLVDGTCTVAGITTLNDAVTVSSGGIDIQSGDLRTQTVIYSYTGVSDTVILSHDAEASTSSATYIVIKTTTLGTYLGVNKTLRIKFDLKSGSDGFTAYGKIYRGATPVGTERSTTSASYTTYSQDITDWNANDTIRLYIHGDGTHSAFIRNLRVCGTLATAVNEVTGANS